LPSVGSYGPAPRKRNPAIAIVAVLALLVIVGGAFALWPKITQAISPITQAISPSATPLQPVASQSKPPATATTTPSQTAMTVTPASTDTSSIAAASTTKPPLSAITLSTPLQTTTTKQSATRTPIVRDEHPANVVTDRSTEPARDDRTRDESARDGQAREERNRQERGRDERTGDEDEGRNGLGRVPAIYVDGPGRHAGNDRALARLRRELHGVREVILLGGGQQIMVYRALHRNIPNLKFGSDSNVTIQWDATPLRLGRERQDLTASATISKDGRVIFRYDLPAGVDASSAADAFAQTIAEAFSD